MRTILETLTIASAEFERVGIDSPRLTAELLLAHALQCRRIDLYVRFDQPVAEQERASFGVLYKRRLSREPLQYLIGSTNFYGLEIEVNSDVLIPRPETEELVELILSRLDNDAIGQPLRILDIGTGSGCIALVLASKLMKAHVVGIDVSTKAIDTAKKNAMRLFIPNCEFRAADIFNEGAIEGMFDIIVSNPPYISADEIQHTQLEVRDFEPRVATTDNADGLTFYRRIAAIAKPHVNPNGFLALEIGAGQASSVEIILREQGWQCEIRKDMAGIERMVVAAP